MQALYGDAVHDASWHLGCSRMPCLTAWSDLYTVKATNEGDETAKLAMELLWGQRETVLF